MMGLLRDLFPAGRHYILREREPGELDTFLSRHLYDPDLTLPRHRLWSREAAGTAKTGRLIGWVGDSVPRIFFTESVREEIAAAAAAVRGRLFGEAGELALADRLVTAAGLGALAQRQPYLLSDGEMKAVLLLTQLAKGPEYLFVNDLARGLSPDRTSSMAAMLKHSERHLAGADLRLPVLVLGGGRNISGWQRMLLAGAQWREISRRLPDEL